jgi:hypothetical protein
MVSGALVVWVNGWQASIDAGKQPSPETLAKLEAHRDGLRALRSQLYLLSICNARQQLRELPERYVVHGPPVTKMGEFSADFTGFSPPPAKRPAAQQGSLL